jgi:hypothetical protein
MNSRLTEKASNGRNAGPPGRSNNLPTPHRHESSWLSGLSRRRRHKRFVYSSDSGYAESLAEFARGVDLLILEMFVLSRHNQRLNIWKLGRRSDEDKRKLRPGHRNCWPERHLSSVWDDVDLETEAIEALDRRDDCRL